MTEDQNAMCQKDEEWKIEPFQEKRRIQSIWWPDGTFHEDNSNQHFFIHRDPFTNEVWVIEVDKDGERRRHNVRHVETIVWYGR